MTEIAGESASGKTQILMQVRCTDQDPPRGRRRSSCRYDVQIRIQTQERACSLGLCSAFVCLWGFMFPYTVHTSMLVRSFPSMPRHTS